MFVNEVTFWSHYNGNWSDIKVSGKKVGVDKVSQDEFDNIDIAENITVKPASRLVRFQNSSKVYIVFGNGNLKYITDAEALKLFGSNWENGLIIIQNGFEIDYSKDNERFVDTDGDGVSDDDEIYFYKTDPNNPDTDGDGYSDGVELLNGYDPNGPGKL